MSWVQCPRCLRGRLGFFGSHRNHRIRTVPRSLPTSGALWARKLPCQFVGPRSPGTPAPRIPARSTYSQEPKNGANKLICFGPRRLGNRLKGKLSKGACLGHPGPPAWAQLPTFWTLMDRLRLVSNRDPGILGSRTYPGLGHSQT